MKNSKLIPAVIYVVMAIGLALILFFDKYNDRTTNTPASSTTIPSGPSQMSNLTSSQPSSISEDLIKPTATLPPATTLEPSAEVDIPAKKTPSLVLPLNNALTRVTKKPFGIKVSPNDSPVSPERFSGYHTGVDFETFPNEQDIDIPVYAICTGPLLLKKTASGYGGVVIQKCDLAGETVTIIYGHLRFSSITAIKDQTFTTGQKLGILGTGYSAETDYERRNLHLGIHKGSSINILGYTPRKSELSNWLDPMEYLQK